SLGNGQAPGGLISNAGLGANMGLRTITNDGVQLQQVHVLVNLDDPKHLGPAALRPLFSIRPIGGDGSDEENANHLVSDAKISCYKNDTDLTRGYWDGWITIPRDEPGFQLMAEVVENDWFFQNVPNNLTGLAIAGPQYWAGADRVTVHIGANP